MKAVLSVALTAVVLGTVSASAQQLDLAALRCREFLDGSKEQANLIGMWLQGYYSEENAAPVVDFDKMRTNLNRISDYCRRFPNHSVSTAAEKVMGQ
jgi:acid stress chaperone HdeB